ncbi:MAG: hypothetical protein U0U67_07505 [Chitinophagales bacterium]
MKQFIIIIISGLFLSACTQVPAGSGGGNPSNGQRIQAKVIRVTCASTVIQILDANYYSLGGSWTVEGTSTTYEHVAVVANKCEFPNNLTEGALFYFKQITEAEASNDCAVCMMYDFPPSKSVFLKVVP